MTAFVVFRGEYLIAVCLTRDAANAIAEKNAYETVTTRWTNRTDTSLVQRPTFIQEVPTDEAFRGITGPRP